MQYNKMKLAVGLFILIFFISLGGFLGFLLKEKGAFDKKYQYFFQVKSAQYFSVGMPIKFSGFAIGTIEEMQLQEDGKVLISFVVTQKNQKWIAYGSTLVLKKPLIGSAHIELHTPQNHNKTLKEGAMLVLVQSDDINDMIEKLDPVVEKMMHIIDNIEKITTYLSSNDSELLSILRNLDAFSKKLVKDDALLTTVTGDKTATKQFIHSLKSLSDAMENMKKITNNFTKTSATLDAKIVEPSSKSLHQFENILEDIAKKLQQLDGIVREVGGYDKDVADIKEEVSMAIHKSNQIIEKVDTLLETKQAQEVELP